MDEHFSPGGAIGFGEFLVLGMNKITTRFSGAPFPLWQPPFALPAVQPQIKGGFNGGFSVGENPLHKLALLSLQGLRGYFACFFHFTPRSKHRGDSKHWTQTALQPPGRMQQKEKARIGKLLREDGLETSDVEPILAKFFRIDTLHFKLMRLCHTGETKPLSPSFTFQDSSFLQSEHVSTFFCCFFLVDKGYSVKELHDVNERWGNSAWKGKPGHQTPQIAVSPGELRKNSLDLTLGKRGQLGLFSMTS